MNCTCRPYVAPGGRREHRPSCEIQLAIWRGQLAQLISQGEPECDCRAYDRPHAIDCPVYRVESLRRLFGLEPEPQLAEL